MFCFFCVKQNVHHILTNFKLTMRGSAVMRTGGPIGPVEGLHRVDRAVAIASAIAAAAAAPLILYHNHMRRASCWRTNGKRKEKNAHEPCRQLLLY